MRKIIKPTIDEIAQIEAEKPVEDVGIVDVNGRRVHKDHMSYFTVVPTAIGAEKVDLAQLPEPAEDNYRPVGVIARIGPALKTIGTIAASVAIVAVPAYALLGNPAQAQATPVFGDVTDSFSLNDSGYDTAGGSSIDDNFFHTDSGIQVRNASGNLASTILLPDDTIYGVAHDGTDLFCSDGGSSIYGYLGNDLWDLGLGISESGARGLGVSDADFYLITDDGANIARINRTTGATLNNYAIDSILGEGFGLDYIPLTNELIASNGTDDIFRLQLAGDHSSIVSWDNILASGLGSDALVGVGYNRANGNLVFNDSEDTGQYATGIPEPATMMLLGAGAFILAAGKGRYKRQGEIFVPKDMKE